MFTQQEEPIVSTGKNWNEHCSGEIVNGKCESETLDSKTDSESAGLLWQSIDPSCCSIICFFFLLLLLLLNPIEGMGIIGKEEALKPRSVQGFVLASAAVVTVVVVGDLLSMLIA
jgi:hypothetical protein